MRRVRSRLWLLTGLLVATGVMVAMGRSMRPSPDRVFADADAAFRAGKPDEAQVLLRRLEGLRAPNAIERLLRAEVAAGLGQDHEAINELISIRDDDPLGPLARLKAGEIELKLGSARRAEAAFLGAIRLLPRSVQPRKQLVFLYSIQRRQADLDAQLTALMELDSLKFAYVLHWTKTRNVVWNPRGDLATLEKYVAADREDRWSRLALIEALRRMDRQDEAERLIATLPVMDPEARAARVSLRLERGDFEGARVLLADGPADSALLARLRGQLAIQQKQGEEAARQFRIAVRADPIDRMALSGLGTALLLLGEPKAAAPYLEMARRHDALHALVARAATAEGERDPKLPHELGMACAAVGRTEEARAWLRLAIEHDPLDGEGQRMLYELEHRSKGKAGMERAGTGKAARGAAPRQGAFEARA